MNIETLSDFFSKMDSTIKVRRDLVNEYYQGTLFSEQSILKLKDVLSVLEKVSTVQKKCDLKASEEMSVSIDLTYEIDELRKDILFLETDNNDFLSHLYADDSNMKNEVADGIDFFKGIKFDNFISDRDGTINNYCGRYRSSIQSAYNSIYLSDFSRFMRNAVILTSAPLGDIGLIDISVDKAGVFVYAGSKGREYLDKDGVKRSFPIKQEKQQKLNEFNQLLKNLLEIPANQIFTLIGSGLQFKFGQTTIARQDINGSIQDQKSEAFLDDIKEIVRKIDPEDLFFKIEDTGKDIEVILTIENSTSESSKDFDKGDGISFLNQELGLNLHSSKNLICGDTLSDLPMVVSAMEYNKNTSAIFVTTDSSLKEKVKSACSNAFFVSKPDALVCLLKELSSYYQ